MYVSPTFALTAQNRARAMTIGTRNHSWPSSKCRCYYCVWPSDQVGDVVTNGVAGEPACASTVALALCQDSFKKETEGASYWRKESGQISTG